MKNTIISFFAAKRIFQVLTVLAFLSIILPVILHGSKNIFFGINDPTQYYFSTVMLGLGFFICAFLLYYRFQDGEWILGPLVTLTLVITAIVFMAIGTLIALGLIG